MAESVMYMTDETETIRKLIDSMTFEEMINAYGAAQESRNGFALSEGECPKVVKFAKYIADAENWEEEEYLIGMLTGRVIEVLEKLYPPTEEAIQESKEWYLKERMRQG